MCDQIIISEINNVISKFKQLKNSNVYKQDLTYLKTYTIDESHTTEIDDAISLERISGKYKLWIHIASPSSYIEFDSAIDRKARKLNSTVYLSTNTQYMLPEILIDKVFSLREQETRDALSLGVILNSDGSVFDSEIVQSLIKVNYRLNYIEADELIDYAPKEEQDLNIISTILQKRKNWRKNLGSMEIVESYGKIFVVDNIPTLKIIDPTLSRQLISEAMILYGNLISEYTNNNKIPVPYRVQESRDEFRKNNNYTENEILKNFLLKKCMGKTYYSTKPLVHKSLGLTSYLHATSPIRRYSDLLVHYQLNSFLNKHDLISKEIIDKYIVYINNSSRQNVIKYREDQKSLLYKWFQINPFKEYQVILLSWINKYKNICILYFVEYSISMICNLNCRINISIGDKISVRDTTTCYEEIIYFQLISP